MSVADVEDYESRYLIMAILGLADPAVTSIGTANPSTLTRLHTVIHEHAETILRAVADGRLPDGLAAHLDAEEDPGLKPRPDRASQLQTTLDTRGRLTYGAIWPRLAGVVTWTGEAAVRPSAASRPYCRGRAS